MRNLDWLNEITEEDNVVITTRMRLSRNLRGMNFPVKQDLQEAEAVSSFVSVKISESGGVKNSKMMKLGKMDELGRQLLIERRIIDKSYDSAKKDPRAVVIKSGDASCIVVNEEDHLQFRSTSGGMTPKKALKRLHQLYDPLENAFDFAKDKDFGYFTSSPILIGTGFRLSYFCHLPALIMTGEIEKLAQRISAASVIIRGYSSDEFYNRSNIIQFHNQATLGVTEETVISALESVMNETIKAEKKQRKKIVKQGNIVIKDRISRSLAVMKNAHLMNVDELAMYHSAVRLGVDIGWIDGISGVELMGLLLYGQSGHLSALTGTPLNSMEADGARAIVVRDKMKNVKMV